MNIDLTKTPMQARWKEHKKTYKIPPSLFISDDEDISVEKRLDFKKFNDWVKKLSPEKLIIKLEGMIVWSLYQDNIMILNVNKLCNTFFDLEKDSFQNEKKAKKIIKELRKDIEDFRSLIGEKEFYQDMNQK